MENNQKNMESKLLGIVHNFLRELQAERALRAISLDASLERELGIDSLKKVELFNNIEKAFDIHLPEKAMVETDTLRDLLKLISKTKNIEYKPQTFSPILEGVSLDLSALKTLPEVLATYALKEPDRPHVMLQNEQGEEQILRYGELFDGAKKIACALLQKGIANGETIAIMLPTSHDFFMAFCGVLLSGAIPVPIYPPFRPDRIEEYAKREAKILQNAQARMLITFSEAKLLSNILRTFVPSLKEVVTIKNLQNESAHDIEIPNQSQHIALIQYTSGSTGDPKGVTITYDNMLANIRAIGKGLDLKPSDVGVSWLPLYHDMGLMSWLCALYFGIPMTIMSPITFLTRPERWLWAIHYHRATVSGGPNFAYELCVKKINSKDIEGLDLSSWRFAFNGAEAVNYKTLERFYKKFSPYGFKFDSFAPVYGLAETTVGLTFPKTRREPLVDKIVRDIFEKENRAIPAAKNDQNSLEILACGEPLPEHEIRIVDDSDQVVSDRTVGNLQFRGPSAMQGYYNNPSATQKAYHDGWWDTGDLGYMVDQELYVTGRKKDLIIKAGRNLFPQEIEEVVNQLSSIRRGCVVAFGTADPTTGTENLVVVAETYEVAEKKRQEIRSEIIEKMAIMLGIPPDVVVLVPPRTIPKTSSGKLQRSQCKKSYLEGKLVRPQLPIKLQFAKLAFINVSKKVTATISYLGKLIYAVYLVMIILITVPFIWLAMLVLPQNTASLLCKKSARIFFRLAGCPITLHSTNNPNENVTTIYTSNHASYVDTLLLLAVLPRGVKFVGKKELLKVPIIRTFIKKLKYLTVDRIDFSKAQQNKIQIKEAIKEGNSIVIFPEGTFTYATGLRPFKLGAFSLAVETTTPICPISLNGTRTILRGETFLPKPGPIKVTIGKLVHPKEQDWNEIIRLHNVARAEIAKHCGEPVIDVIVAGPVID